MDCLRAKSRVNPRFPEQAVKVGKPMEPLAAHSQPSNVVAEQGNIVIDGPNGVAVTMSPDAAEETAGRPMKAVAKARLQRVSRL